MSLYCTCKYTTHAKDYRGDIAKFSNTLYCYFKNAVKENPLQVNSAAGFLLLIYTIAFMPAPFSVFRVPKTGVAR